ncbi:efflux RND transporter periplasmic adaptor subunit [Candidatus Uhrbacteria bacterium]|nr:efflux RND transporter periplasmic adaptor subunit [Candidatus Uhrbacteria bacterium]
MTIPHILKRWWFWLILIAIISGLVYLFYPKTSPVSYTTEIVHPQNLVQTVDASAEVQSLDKVDLSFDLSGTVDQILVEVGDEVQIGDLLGFLDSRELNANVQSAYQAVQVAQSNLNAQKAGATEEKISVSERALDITNASLNSAQVDYDNKLALIDLVTSVYKANTGVQSSALSAASDNLNQIIQDNAQLIADAYDDLLSVSWAGIVEGRSAVTKADEILGIRNTTLNDDYENLLSSSNSSAVELARTAFYASEEILKSAESHIVSVGYGSSGAIVSVAEEVEDLMDSTSALLLYVRSAISGMPATGDLSVTEAINLGSSVDAVRVALQTDQTALQNAFQTVQSALRVSSSNLEDAQNALAQAEASYDASVANEDYYVTSAEQSASVSESILALRQAEVAQSEASLAQVQATPRTIDLASYEAEVARAQAAYQSAVARLGKTEIHSPIVGNVTEIFVEEGEQVVAANRVMTIQTTQEQFEIIADVSESDIAKVALDDSVLITFDAFDSSVELTGHVVKIDPAEKLIEGVVYYEVSVYLDAFDQSIALRPGLSADLIITTQQKDQVLSVPQRAVFEKEGISYVRLLINGVPEERKVEIGLRGDLGRVEILSGLREGDEVIVREVTEE